VTIKLLQTIAQKAADQDGLTAADRQEIKKQFGHTPKVEEALHIFDDLVVDTGERQRLIQLLHLDTSAQAQLTSIIGKDGTELARKQAESGDPTFALLRDTTQPAKVRAHAIASLGRSKDIRAYSVLVAGAQGHSARGA